jgi:hypothetical protein
MQSFEDAFERRIWI